MLHCQDLKSPDNREKTFLLPLGSSLKKKFKPLDIQASLKLANKACLLAVENVLCLHIKDIKHDTHTLYLVDVAIHIIAFMCRPKPMRDHPRSILFISRALLWKGIRVSAQNTRRKNRSYLLYHYP